MPPTIVLITGANRGLGKGFLERHLATPNYTVIAANRNPEHFTSKDLGNLPKALGSSLIIVKVDSASRSDALGAVDELRGGELSIWASSSPIPLFLTHFRGS